jgi:putative copper resistance protein D
MDGGPFAAWMLACTVFLNAALACALGAVASLQWTKGAESSWAKAAERQSRKFLRNGVVVSIIASAALLSLQSAAMAETPLSKALPAVASMVRSTHYGHAWLVGIAALLAVAAVSWRSRLPKNLTQTAGAGLALFALSRSLVSHAAAQGDVTLAVAIDWTHLVLVGLWAGMVFVSTSVLLQPVRLSSDRLDAASWITRLSMTATLALAGIVVTGLANTWRSTEGAIGQLVGSPYGTALFIKLALVLAAAAMGAFNRFRVLPALLSTLRTSSSNASQGVARFTRTLQIEAAVLLAVLVAAAFLSSSLSPGEG